MRRRLLLPVVLGGDPWQAVAAPDEMFSYVPFTIQKNGGVFRVDPSFDLLTYADIAVSKTYYVDKAATGTGTGLSWANAFTTLGAAFSTADYDRIYVKAGYYFRSETLCAPGRSFQLIADGGDVYLTRDFRNQIGAYSAVDDHYSATISGGHVGARVYDHSNLDAFGGDTLLTLKTSEAEVDATANSWYQSGTTIYIHTFDGRAPDADLRYASSGTAFFFISDNKSCYVEGVRFFAGSIQVRSNGTGGMKGYFKDCWAQAYSIQGMDEIIFQNCKSFLSYDDGWNYDVRAPVTNKAIEIDCEGYHGGIDTNHQASTLHTNCIVVSINSSYHDTTGQNVSDTGYRWALGCEMYSSATNIGVRSSAGAIWLDTCSIHDNTTSLQTGGASAAIHKRNVTITGTEDTASGGTIDTY